MGFKETRAYLEKCISKSALAALSALPPGVINCVCVCVCSELRLSLREEILLGVDASRK